MIFLLTGAIVFASVLVGLVFLRFYLRTRDRFFFYFACSFWIEGMNRLYSAVTDSFYTDSFGSYVVRLIAYGLILVAIWEKNMPKKIR